MSYQYNPKSSLEDKKFIFCDIDNKSLESIKEIINLLNNLYVYFFLKFLISIFVRYNQKLNSFIELYLKDGIETILEKCKQIKETKLIFFIFNNLNNFLKKKVKCYVLKLLFLLILMKYY